MEKQVIYHKPTAERHCPICESSDYEQICSFSGQKIGIKNVHNVVVSDVICKRCGFVYTSPSLTQDEWNIYYNDMYPGFRSNEDYSVEKRIGLIRKYLNKEDCIVEIGGNEQGEFTTQLRAMALKYISFDVNENCGNDIKSLDQATKVNIVVSYYAFEHIVEINEIVEKCSSLILENGYLIVEVPDANLYFKDPASLELHEHVNHFTPQSLSALISKHGFSCVEISRYFASRNGGFVGVFQKTEPSGKSEYVINRSLIHDGQLVSQGKVDNFEKAVQALYEINGDNRLENVALWCISNMATALRIRYEEVYGSSKPISIDEDEKKRDYYGTASVCTSKQVFETPIRNKLKYIVICSFSRVEAIMESLKKYSDILSELQIYAIDNTSSLIRIK